MKYLIAACLCICLVTPHARCQFVDYLATRSVEWSVSLESDQKPSNLIQLGDRTVFLAGERSRHAVFSTDGHDVTNLGQIPRDGYALERTEDRAYFVDRNAIQDAHVYATDGLSLNSVAVPPLGFFDFDVVLPTGTAVFDDRLYFYANGEDGWGLYQTDGAQLDHFPLNIPGSAYHSGRIFGELNGLLVFAGGDVDGRGIFSTDGQDISRLTVGGRDLSRTSPLHVWNNDFLFVDVDEAGDTFLRTDGVTVRSTGTFADQGRFRRGDRTLAVGDDFYFFGTPAPGSVLKQLFSTDGSSVTEYHFQSLNGNFADLVTSFDGEVYFRGKPLEPIGEQFLFRTDGDTVRPLLQLSGSSNMPQDGFTIEHDGLLYFTGEISLGDRGTPGLFQTNGETVERVETNGNQAELRPRPVGSTSGSVFFSADGPNGIGLELLEINGGQQTWYDLSPGNNSLPRFLAQSGTDLFFTTSPAASDGPVYVVNEHGVTGLGNVKIYIDGDHLFIAESRNDSVGLFKIAAHRCGDFDGDGDVDTADRVIQTSNWTGARLAGPAEFADGDCDADGDVDTADINGLLTNWTSAVTTIDVAAGVLSIEEFFAHSVTEPTASMLDAEASAVNARFSIDEPPIVDAGTASIAVVPEPTSAGLLVMALSGLLNHWRRGLVSTRSR